VILVKMGEHHGGEPGRCRSCLGQPVTEAADQRLEAGAVAQKARA